jgi:thioredoxin-related protein
MVVILLQVQTTHYEILQKTTKDMRRFRILLTTIFITTYIFSASLSAQEVVNWQPIQQAETLAKKLHRKVLIEIYTQWSEGFKELERSVLAQPQVVKYLNDNFVAIKFDAETHDEVNFQDHNYKFVTQSGVGFNELAAELLRGQMSYPTFVFLDENGNLIQTIQYRTPEHFEMIITYFGSDNHKKMPWKKYEKVFLPLRAR